MRASRGYGLLRTAIAAVSKSSSRTAAELIQRRAYSAKVQWTCPSCLQKTQSKSLIVDRALQRENTSLRRISSSISRQDEPRKPIEPTTPPITPPEPAQEPTEQPEPPASSLPSETAQQRWQYSQRLHTLMDTLLARASLASQRINTYTGTDYSGIESLRNRILAQETTVRSAHSAVDTARTHHREAHAKQSSAQKEIVSLLERKSSWSPSDLERYMGLVRSEHSLEADVSSAKDDLQSAERELEEARALLERLERKQYHEEQVWSDTIRRNSTWVTFGLMGVNILLLVANIVVFEPWRRRRIVREVKRALDEKAVASGVVGAAQVVEVKPEVGMVVDEVVEPVGQPVEVVEKAVAREDTRGVAPEQPSPDATPLTAEEVLAEEAAKLKPQAPSQPPLPKHPDTWTGSWEATVDHLQDLFSERVVQVKKVDLTTMALQGAATGVAAMGLLFVVFRPR